MQKKFKLAFIGAGSIGFTRGLLSDILSVTGSGLKINFFIGFLSLFYLRGIPLLPPPTDEQSFIRGKSGNANITVTINSGIIICRII